MSNIQEDRELLLGYISDMKDILFHSKYINIKAYDNICDVLDVLVNTVEDNLKEEI